MSMRRWGYVQIVGIYAYERIRVHGRVGLQFITYVQGVGRSYLMLLL